MSFIFQRLSFKNKLLISYFVLISIPLAISSIYFFNQVIASVSRNSMEIVGQRLSQEEANLNKQVGQVEQAAHFFITNPIFNKYFENDYYNDVDRIVVTNNYIIPLISWQASMNSNISNIRFITDNHNILEGDFIEWSDRHQREKWFETTRQSVQNHGFFWEEIHSPRNYRYQKKSASSRIYSLFAKLQGLSFQTKTILEITVNPDSLFTILNSQPIGQTGYIVVADKHRTVISGSRNATQNTKLLADVRLSNHTERITVNRITYVVAVKKYPKLNCYLIGVVPLNELLKPLVRSRNIFLIMIGAGLVGLSVLAYLIAEFLLLRVKRILKAVRKIQQGNFMIHLPSREGDEIDELANDINLMADKIDELFKKAYQAELAQKEAIINALQMQINPHFIFNTLETFKMMAELRDEEELSEGLTALGNFIRYNTSIGNKLVTIRQEIENVRDYVKIQNLMLNNRLHVSFQLEESLADCRIPNLVIQPQVENAIIHGYKDREDPIVIQISIKQEASDVIIRVRDNGGGIPEERMKQIQAVLNEQNEAAISNTHRKGIGLVNVNRRLKLCFGERYGLEIGNDSGSGTEVMIRIPTAANHEAPMNQYPTFGDCRV